jgi:phosphoglucomutase
MSILAKANQTKPGTDINAILLAHYKKYGRSFFSRYDYEEVASEGAEAMMAHLRETFASSSFAGSAHKATSSDASFTVAAADDFAYTDPIDGSVSTKQGLRIMFTDGSRIIFRLSGTGSSGATVRLYVEKYSRNEAEYADDAQVGLKPLIEVALQLSKLQEYTKRDKPNVIT